MTEKHVIKIIVDIRRVKLLVRFPCKLTFQLKTGYSFAIQTVLKSKLEPPMNSKKDSASSIRLLPLKLKCGLTL